MVLRQIPNKHADAWSSWACRTVCNELMHAAARAVPGHRPDRLGQEHVAGQHDQLSQRERRPPHHHDRRPDRVLPPRTRSRRSTSARSASTCRSFAEAIRRALRQDPDVILVGEMRDLETIEAAITAAETGHVVFGTLHTTERARARSTASSTSFRPISRNRFARSCRRRSSASCRQALLPKIGGGRVRGVRDAGRHARPSPT